MADLRYTTVVGQFQTELTDLISENPMVPTVLEAMAAPLENISETNTFREYISNVDKGTSSTLTVDRAKTSLNTFTTNPSYNGALASSSLNLEYIDHTIEDTWSKSCDIDLTGGIDAKHNSPSAQAARAFKMFSESFRLWKDDKISAKALESNTWIVPAAATITLGAAVTAGATTFEISDADKASSGLAAGAIVKIANTRANGSVLNAEKEYIDVVQIKTVGADESGTGTNSLITIVTNRTEMSTSMSQFGDTFVNGLRTSLRAHADGTTVQIDTPTAITTTNIDSIVQGIRTKATRAYIYGKALTLYVTPEVYEVMQGVSASGVFAPMAANDFLGKEVLMEGDFAQMRGMMVTSNANALAREGGVSDAALAKPIHYIWAFEAGKTFGYGMRDSFSTTQEVQGSAVLKRHIEYKICGFTMLYSGSQKSFLLPVTV